MTKYMATLLLLASISVAVNAQTWPLKIPISQSSSFAEFRGMRFHAGIDLRTQRKNGFPVIAIADGYISRASVQFRGYGYAIYVDHPELQARVVYGHLQDFQGPLKEYIDAKLKKMGKRHGVNDFFKPDRFPVRKGQVLALSGETGSGPPHLHFEMRTLADEPLAPALFGFRPADNIFPVFHDFYLEPMSYACVIDGSFLPQKLSLKKKNRSEYTFSRTPEVSGSIALKAGISDTNGEGNRYGIEKYTLEVDGSTAIERVFHKYSYDKGRQCPWVYDYFKSYEKGAGYVYLLYKLPYDTLPFAKDYQPWSGLIEASAAIPVKKSILLTAQDYGNNAIRAQGAVALSPLNFITEFSSHDIKAYSFTEIEQTMHSLIAIGKTAKAQAGKNAEMGLIACTDKTGKTELLKCIRRGSSFEIAFPKEKRWQFGAWAGETRVLPETVLIDDSGGTLSVTDKARAVFNRNSLREPMFCQLSVINLKPRSGGNKKRGYLKPFSPVYKLEPSDKVFDAEVKVSLTPQAYNGNLQKLGVYSLAKNGTYRHNGEKMESGMLSFTTRAGGAYVILEDLIPPVLSYSRKSTDYHLGPVYVFKASDLGEGVDYLSASAKVGGQSAEVYSDPDKAEIYVVRPKSGKRKVELQVKDYAGNLGKISKTID